MNNSPSSRARRGSLALTRLERLTDVVYGIIVWQLFMLIPTPDTVDYEWGSFSAYLGDSGLTIAVVLIGIGWTIIYWLQSNRLFAALETTDTWHSALSIFQLFFLFVFLYSMKLGVDIGGMTGTWALESGSATVVGLCSLLAFQHARRGRRLLHPDVTDEEARKIALRYRAEPLTNGITFPFAFIPGPLIFGFNLTWEFSFFLYPIVVAVMSRLVKRLPK
ncbi:MAG: hypothetical protein OEU54_10205 [Gemmatimonadota bacterium]|nr:hypothetical protein [Gemmatimonadota bacterium]